MKKFCLVLVTLLLSAMAYATDSSVKRIASLNPCFDSWVPQWLPPSHEFIPSTLHGNRLERLLALQPDVILYGTYTNRRLVAELQKTMLAVEVVEPTSWQQWQNSLRQLAVALNMVPEINHWAAQQTNQLRQIEVTSKSILFVMPNQYTWGGNSFAVDLLRQFSAKVQVIDEHTTIHQLQLEQLIQLQPQRVVLDGFSSNYARANEWLWHNALQPWLAQRQLRQIPTAVSGCPAQQAVAYFNKAVGI